MTQFSFPWPGIAPGSGADAGQYTAAQWWARATAMLQTSGMIVAGGLKTEAGCDNLGVFPSIGNDLEVTSPAANSISINTGAGIADGTIAYNDASLGLSIPSAPVGSSRIDLIVLRKNYSAVAYTPAGSLGDEVVAAYTARITRIVGTAAAVPVAPFMTQDDARTTYWDIPLASFEIDNIGAITSLTDLREFARSSREVRFRSVLTDTGANVLTLIHNTSGVAAAGFGGALSFQLDDDAGNANEAARIAAAWRDPTAAAEYGRLELWTVSNGAINLVAVFEPTETASAVVGDTRGRGAVDLQGSRSLATHVAAGVNSFIAGGVDNRASGARAHAEGYTVTAQGNNSHAEGQQTLASGIAAHAEGEGAEASGTASHAEGLQGEASGEYSHAEGYMTEASGDYSHAGGYQTIASGEMSHTEGINTIAAGIGAHAEGAVTSAEGSYSHAEGRFSVAERYTQAAFSSGRFAASGDAQGSRFVLLGDETHGDDVWRTITIANLTGDDAYRMKLAADSVWIVDALITGTIDNTTTPTITA